MQKQCREQFSTSSFSIRAEPIVSCMCPLCALRDLRKSQKLFDMGLPAALVSEGGHSESKTGSGPVGLESVAWPEDILAGGNPKDTKIFY